MAREIEIRAWCDPCFDDGHMEEATYRDLSVAVGGGRALTIDLCERHHKELIQPVLDALWAFGVDPNRVPTWKPRNRNPGRQAGPFKCLVEGCIAAPLKHRGTLWQHLRLSHQTTLDAYLEEHGELVPLTAEEQAEVIELRCEMEGCGKVYCTADGIRWPHQALRAHLLGVHGIKLLPNGVYDAIRP